MTHKVYVYGERDCCEVAQWLDPWGRWVGTRSLAARFGSASEAEEFAKHHGFGGAGSPRGLVWRPGRAAALAAQATAERQRDDAMRTLEGLGKAHQDILAQLNGLREEHAALRARVAAAVLEEQ